MTVSRDDDGFFIPQEPMYVFWTERDTESAKKYGPSYPQPDIVACRDGHQRLHHVPMVG